MSRVNDRLRSFVMSKSGRPILVGPWRSELGFEALYWLPWLAAWRERYRIPADRLVAVTRGGAGVWYGMGHAVDVYDYMPLERLRHAMLSDSQQHGSIKQNRRRPWEAPLLDTIAQGLGLRRYHVLHPSVMYQELAPWWDGRLGLQPLLSRLSFAPIPAPVPPLTLPLPERYVAVRFYARHTWPLSDEIKAWTANLVDGLAKHVPVVLLESAVHADDHVDFPLQGPNIIHIAPHVTPQTNLAVQSAVIAKAQAFVGTYGGTMQLAVRLKKPAVGFYQKFERTCYAHKLLTEWLAVQQGTPCFIGRPDDARLMKEAMG